MFISYALRLLLIVNGGQLYHPDELRYYRSIEVTKHIFNGDVKNAVKTLLKYEFSSRHFHCQADSSAISSCHPQLE